MDLQIRQAMERGEFDDLPGAGKPIEGLGAEHDPDWWLKKLVERERIAVLPPSLALRKEDAELDDRLDRLNVEADVRREVEEFNAARDPGPLPPARGTAADHDAARRRGDGRRLARPSYGAGRGPARRPRAPSSPTAGRGTSRGTGAAPVGAAGGPGGPGVALSAVARLLIPTGTAPLLGSAPCEAPRTSSAPSPWAPPPR